MMEPRILKIKRTLQPYAEGGRIYFGFGNSSLIREVEDTHRNRMLLCSSDLEKDASGDELDMFIKMGVVTDNKYDDSRFSRNLNFFEWIDESNNISPSFYQEKLRRGTVLIVGIGGIGGAIAESLVRLGMGRLILVDFDVVDESNLTRQTIYGKENVGESKVQSAKAYLESIGDVDIEIVDTKISSSEDLDNLYRKHKFDLAVCSADTPSEIDYWFDDAAHKYRLPFIAGSYASTVINYACIVPGKTLSLRTFYEENRITDEHLIPEKLKTSVIAPVTLMAAGLISYKIFAVLTGLNNDCDCIQIDLLTWDVHKYDISRK